MSIFPMKEVILPVEPMLKVVQIHLQITVIGKNLWVMFITGILLML